MLPPVNGFMEIGRIGEQLLLRSRRREADAIGQGRELRVNERRQANDVPKRVIDAMRLKRRMEVAARRQMLVDRSEKRSIYCHHEGPFTPVAIVASATAARLFR